MTDCKDIRNALISCDGPALMSLVKQAVENNTDAGRILNDGLIAGMDVVGEKMQNGDMFIPEVLMSAKCMADAVTVLKPLLGEGEMNRSGHIVVGTVKGDLHDIGKNLVIMMLESAGFQITDLGVDVDPETFVQTIEAHDVDILALSALLTTTMPMMEKTVQVLKDKGLDKKVRIIVGGAPVDQAFADKIGADGYAADAGAAGKLARTMIA